MTKIVNLFGGPCIGKSTLAAELFAYFKKNTDGEFELVNEVAKDFSWEERWKALSCQPYIFGKQLFKQHKLVGKVDYIFTDSPLLLSNVYDSQYFSTNFPKSVVDIFKTFDNMNYVLEREDGFNEKGRHHNLEESLMADEKIKFLLTAYDIPYIMVKRDEAFKKIVEDIKSLWGIFTVSEAFGNFMGEILKQYQ